jgi:hypothetical protein
MSIESAEKTLNASRKMGIISSAVGWFSKLRTKGVNQR